MSKTKNVSDVLVAIPWQKAGEAAKPAKALTVINGGFETGDLSGWTVLTEGWTDNPNRGVISATSYWTEELPYNQAGNYHLDGWNTGIAEGGTWEVKSSTFTLGGSGYILPETPENTNGEDAEEPSADVDNTVTGPAPDDPIAEPTPNDPDPAMPVDEEDDPALKDDDDPDGEGSPIQEEKPESEEEPNAESQNGEP